MTSNGFRAAIGVLAVAGIGIVSACSVQANVRPGSGGQPESRPASTPGQKRALIVTIGNYKKGTGWTKLSSAQDVPLMRRALESQGFAPGDIHTLSDKAANKQGILDAIDEHLLKGTQPGAVLVFHYSGHGQRVPDDGREEPDGYDEAIVPFDAPSELSASYKGHLHLRDDELAIKMQALRAAAGPTGNVVAFYDSCFSGAIARGLAKKRAGPPLGPAAPLPETPRQEATGLYEPAATRGTDAAARKDLAPYVVFSSSRFDEEVWETPSPTGAGKVGPLSYALSASIPLIGPGTSYLTLFKRVETMMQRLVPHAPQIEGDIDREVFSNRLVKQNAFLEVLSVAADGKKVVLEGGKLLALLPGTSVAIHGAEAETPTAETRLAEGKVTASTLSDATVTLNARVDPARLRKARAFLTRYSFGDLRIRVALRDLDAALNQTMKSALTDLAAIELVSTNADFMVSQERDGDVVRLTITDVASGIVLWKHGQDERYPDNPEIDTANRLEDLARNRYLRRLALANAKLDVKLEIVPVTLSACARPEEPDEDSCTVTRGDVEQFRTTGQGLAFPKGTLFKLRLTPPSKDAYVTVLDLAPDGTIGVFAPEDPKRRETTEPGLPKDLPGVWRFKEPAGLEVFMAVASDNFVNFSSFRKNRSRGETMVSGDAGVFAPLFEEGAIRKRAERVMPAGGAAISMVPVTVTP